MPLSLLNQYLFDSVRENNLAATQKAITDGAKISITDDHGNTPLHEAAYNNNLPMVTLLLKHGAKTYWVNRNFETPLQYSMRSATTRASPLNALGTNVILQLIRYHTPIDDEYLKGRIDFCVSHHKDDIENKSCRYFVASQLVGMDINKLAHLNHNKNLWKYHSHLLSLEGHKKEYAELNTRPRYDHTLTGFDFDAFLPLRLLSLLTIVVDLELAIAKKSEINIPLLNKDMSSQQAVYAIIKLLRQEILNEIQTLHISQTLKTIQLGKRLSHPDEVIDQSRLLSSTMKPIARQQLAKYICAQLQLLPEGNELTFAGGWDSHAIYINFIRIGNNIVINIDNVGNGCRTCHPDGHPYHAEDIDRRQAGQAGCCYLFSAILGVVPLADLNPNLVSHFYFEDIMRAYFQTDSRAAIDKIYIKYKPPLTEITPADLSLVRSYSAKIQSVGNCAGKNHGIGLRRRLKHSPYYEPTTRLLKQNELYRWLREEEFKRSYPKSDPLPENYDEACWMLEKKARSISLFVDNMLRQHYRNSHARRLLDAKPIHIEEIYIPIHLYQPASPTHLSLTDLFKNVKRMTRRILIIGQSGIGKSALCSYIANQWAQNKLWKGQFRTVIRLSLNHFNDTKYKQKLDGTPYSLEEVLHKEFSNLPHLTRERYDRLAESSLWLFDGLDELPQFIPNQLHPVIKQLFNMPNYLVTSRPVVNYQFVPKDESIGELKLEAFSLTVDIEYELMGFTDSTMLTYIKFFFKRFPEKEKEFREILKKSPDLREFARVPVLLEIMSSLKMDTRLDLNDLRTKTELYQCMIGLLLKRYAIERGANPSSAKLTPDELEDKYAEELMILEHLAFAGLKRKQYVIDKVLVKNILDKLYEKSFQAGKSAAWEAPFAKAKTLGFLKLKDAREIHGSSENDYYFLHITIQEFFAARHLQKQLQHIEASNAPNIKNVMRWLSINQYNDIFHQVLPFLAGLLSISLHRKEILNKKNIILGHHHFWDVLNQFQEVTGWLHLKLIIKCLEECINIDQTNTKLLLALNHLIVQKIFTSHPDNNTLIENHLTQLLSQSPFVTQYIFLEKTLITLLAAEDYESSCKWINFILKIGKIAFTEIFVNILLSIIKTNRHPLQKYAASCFIQIGDQGGTREVLDVLITIILQYPTNLIAKNSLGHYVLHALLAMKEAAMTAHVQRRFRTALSDKSRLENTLRNISLIQVYSKNTFTFPALRLDLKNIMQNNNSNKIRTLAAGILLRMGVNDASHFILLALNDWRSELRIAAADVIASSREEIELNPLICDALKDRAGSITSNDHEDRAMYRALLVMGSSVTLQVLKNLFKYYCQTYDFHFQRWKTMQFSNAFPEFINYLTDIIINSWLPAKRLNAILFLNMFDRLPPNPQLRDALVLIIGNKDNHYKLSHLFDISETNLQTRVEALTLLSKICQTSFIHDPRVNDGIDNLLQVSIIPTLDTLDLIGGIAITDKIILRLIKIIEEKKSDLIAHKSLKLLAKYGKNFFTEELARSVYQKQSEIFGYPEQHQYLEDISIHSRRLILKTLLEDYFYDRRLDILIHIHRVCFYEKALLALDKNSKILTIHYRSGQFDSILLSPIQFPQAIEFFADMIDYSANYSLPISHRVKFPVMGTDEDIIYIPSENKSHQPIFKTIKGFLNNPSDKKVIMPAPTTLLPIGYTEVDTPNDYHCLFWSAALALLLPEVENKENFTKLYLKLFGKGSISLDPTKNAKKIILIEHPDTIELARHMLRLYDCKKDTPKNFKENILEYLVCKTFRERVVNTLSEAISLDQRPSALLDRPAGTTWESYLEYMRGSAFAGEPEIRAVSLLVGVNIEVFSSLYGQPRISHCEGANRTIYLVHANSNNKIDGTKNHYHFGLSNRLYNKHTQLAKDKPISSPKSTVSITSSALFDQGKTLPKQDKCKHKPLLYVPIYKP